MPAIHFITRTTIPNVGERFHAKFSAAITWAQAEWPSAQIEIDADQGTAIVRDRKNRPLATMRQVELH